MKLIFALIIIVSALCNSAFAADATCSDYSRSKEEDRSLFNGFIYGFVTAKIGERGDAEVNTAVARIKEMADKYCSQHPTDRFSLLISNFGKVVFVYGSNGSAPPSPWETHKQCEELALKLTYPRKLNGCQGDDCKGLTETWMEETVRAKKDCLQKKLG